MKLIDGQTFIQISFTWGIYRVLQRINMESELCLIKSNSVVFFFLVLLATLVDLVQKVIG